MNTSNIRPGSLMACLLATILLQGCAGTPTQNAQLDQARNDYASAGSDQRVVRAAPEQLRQASGDINRAAALQKDGASQGDVDHYAHLAILQVTTARQLAAADASQAYVVQAGDRRNQVMLQASRQQTRQAQLQADTADARASDADAKTMQAQQQNQQMQVDAANTNAADADAQAAQTRQQNTALLAALDAKQTDRGLVLTLGSVLFESNDADLNASGERSMDKLAQFLRDNPRRNVRVEGYTDSTGSASYNQDLSKRRADAVSSALVSDGVASQRTESKGFGEEFAVASNRTASGRQQNRRVEIVISSADGSFPATR